MTYRLTVVSIKIMVNKNLLSVYHLQIGNGIQKRTVASNCIKVP